MKQLYAIPLFETGAIASTALVVPLIASGFASLFEIGIIGAAYGLANFVSYFLFGRLSDTKGRRRPFIIAGLACASCAALLHVFMHDVASAILFRALLGFSVGIYYFPMIAYIAAAQSYKKKMGVFLGLGSLGWSLGTFLSGASGAGQFSFIISCVLFAIGFLISLSLPPIRHKELHVPRFPAKLIRKNLGVYLSFLVRHSGAQSVWIIFPLFLLSIGASPFFIGVIYALNTFGQFFIMNWLGAKLEGRDERRFMEIGYILSACVFILYFFAQNPYQILPIQLILATGWSFVWLGSMINLSSRNEEKATSTGILGSMNGLAQAIGPFLGGAIAQLLGFHAVFVFAAIMCLLPLVISRKFSLSMHA